MDDEEAGTLKILYSRLEEVSEYPGYIEPVPLNLITWYRKLFSLDVVMQYYVEQDLKDISKNISMEWRKVLQMPHDIFIVKGYRLLYRYLELVGTEFSQNGLLLESPEGINIINDLFSKCLSYEKLSLFNKRDVWYWQSYMESLNALLSGYTGDRGGKEYVRQQALVERDLDEDAKLYPSEAYVENTIIDLYHYLGIISAFLQDRDPNNGIIPLHVTRSDTDVGKKETKIKKDNGDINE